jgi:clan AA aspartic protease (TIGR02281 family)
LALQQSAAILLFLSLLVSPVWPQSNPSAPIENPPAGLPIYATAEETGQVIGILRPGENMTPIAETRGSGGLKWFLVKTNAGLTGWIKQDNAEQSKQADNFFKSLPADPASISVTIPSVSSSAAPQGAIMVPVLSAGRSSMIVTALMNQRISGNLMIDTGASNTVISKRLAKLLTLQAAGKAFVHTVGGPVQVAVARLGSLKVGAAEIKNLPVLVHDFSPDPHVEGLLGMDFLGHYQVGFDSRKQLLILSPR